MNLERRSCIERWLAALGATALLVASTAPSLAAESVRDWGIVMARDLEAHTLSIDDTTYKVVPGTTFKDLEGKLIDFASLEIYDVHQGIFAIRDATLVEFVARMDGGVWYLVSVERVRELPR